ncbi:FecR family protein [Mucilaginibacter litoreus]|uniref:FecR family protein n=1 Tax=Mucilaginibacter litoreus TaxID=1048221 RepID=A0ABW3AM60_9SPHI
MSSTEHQLLLIIQHLNTPDDTRLQENVTKWRTQSAENEKYFQEIQTLWLASAEARVLKHIDVNAAVERLSSKLEDHNKYKHEASSLTTGVRIIKWIAGIAAMFMLVFFIYRQYPVNSAKYITKITTGKKDSVLLADGSKIFLDTASSVSYPEQFNGNKRTIAFKHGNAFFKIAHDSIRPFTVSMDQTAVQVLGTSFNIRKTTAAINVDVKTGRVMFLANEESKAVLVAGVAANYDIKSNQLTTYSNQNSNSDSWLTGELHFIDEPLANVFSKLESHYRVKITSDTNLSKLGKFNANFINNNLDEVITVLEQTYPINITRHSNRLIIRNK